MLGLGIGYECQVWVSVWLKGMGNGYVNAIWCIWGVMYMYLLRFYLCEYPISSLSTKSVP